MVRPAHILPHPTYRFSSAGFPDHVPPPRGDDLPHHVVIREQHGACGNTGHVSPRCRRRADRGERWMVWAWWWSAEAQSSAQWSLSICDLIGILPQSLLYCQMSPKQLFSSSCALFFYQGCQDGQLRQMSDTVQPPVCNVCSSLHKFQAWSLPCLVSVASVLFTPP